MPISKSEAIASAEANASGLRRHALWQAAFEGAVAGGPVTVRLDPSGTETPYYFIVSFAKGSEVTARMAIDADSAAVREVQGIDRPGALLRGFVDPLSVVSSALSGSPPGLEPELYWRPSRASLSMLEPFFVVSVAGQRLFVRVDGTVFESLDAAGHG